MKRKRTRTPQRRLNMAKSFLSETQRAALTLAVCALLCVLGMAALAWPRTNIGLLAMSLPGFVSLAAQTQTPQESAAAAMTRPADPAFSVKVRPTETQAPPQSQSPRPKPTPENEPLVLIYHTHATEAYFPTENNPYTPSGSWRTKDNGKNVVAVGERLAEELRKRYGICVLHDTTNHEPPKLSSSYSRSEQTMRKYRDEYPSLILYIDLHRDAYGNNVSESTDFVTIDGKQVARMMFVVGTGEGAMGTGFDEMPDFESNHALAEQITAYLNTIDPRLTRNVRVKTGRYNQHIAPHCLLVEVGHNANTLEQAFAAIPYLAAGIADAVESICSGADTKTTMPPNAWVAEE